MTLKRLFLITGDASGDVHGSVLIQRFQSEMPQVQIEAIGGERIAATGVPLFYHQQKMGALGGDVFRAIPSHYFLGMRLLKHLDSWKPDAVILIDYGMFNLWIAKHLKARGIKVFYYIPPQVWASRRGRLHKIKQNVDHVFCIFPFEKPLYDAFGIPATYVGHPLAEQIRPLPDRALFCQQHGLNPDLPIIGIFPGSRRSELKGLMAPMLQAMPLIQASGTQRYQFLLARSSAISDDFFNAVISPFQNVVNQVPFKILSNLNHEILALSRAAMVASGTVTLEAALYSTPVVISYKLSWLAYQCFRRFSYVSHIGLPNLLVDDPAGFLPELLMENVTPQAFSQALQPYLTDSPEWHAAQAHFAQIQKTLGEMPASLNVVNAVSDLI